MTQPLKPAQREAILDALPPDRPFCTREARDLGVRPSQLRLLTADGRLVRRLLGVYCRSDLPDSVELRLACVAIEVPADCVVTDRTAAWIWCGDRALAPGEHQVLPRISVFAPPGRRLRNDLTRSGERRLGGADVTEVMGVLVTTPLRTACDLGRLLHVDQAFAAMDTLAGLRAFSVDELVGELVRFKGYRGIIQARTWAPLIDHRAESQYESIARRRWLTAGLPVPECQCPETGPDGGSYHVDFGLPEERFGVEYLGEEFHPLDRPQHELDRLDWLTDTRGWSLVEARSHNVTGPHQDLERTLATEWARRRAGRPVVLC